MKLIVGLGNPGKAYGNSRHNIGFLIIDNLAKKYAIKLKRAFGACALAVKGEIEGHPVALAEPLTYMNLSGRAVGALVKKYKVSRKDLLIVCDDLDLDFGRIKIKSGGSSGGHRGLESVIGSLGGIDFGRLRIGIGRPANETVAGRPPHKNEDVTDYVLAPFDKEEKKSTGKIIDTACECIGTWITEGMEKAMSTFNKSAST